MKSLVLQLAAVLLVLALIGILGACVASSVSALLGV